MVGRYDLKIKKDLSNILRWMARCEISCLKTKYVETKIERISRVDAVWSRRRYGAATAAGMEPHNSLSETSVFT